MRRILQRMLYSLMAGTLLLASLGAGATEADAHSTQTPQPQATEEPTDSPRPAKGYVLVTTATQSGWLPLPEEGEVSYPLRQMLPNGEVAVNTIHLTPDGVCMEDSTCEGHDCVQQGEVTLENRTERILGNMIICLPNQVTLQLYTPEELLEISKGQQ